MPRDSCSLFGNSASSQQIGYLVKS